MELNNLLLDVEQSVEVQGSPEEVFKSVLYRFGEGHTEPNGKKLNLQIEPFAGGRWFRDLGAGTQYLWGHVQVIKAPVRLELSGPMFMSYPALNHIEITLEQVNTATKITLRHRALGMIEEAHRQGLTKGWGQILDQVKNDFTKADGTKA